MNKRFYFDGCKFTLSPGQSLSHHHSEPHDEGYSYRSFTLRNDGGVVTAEIASGGRDCDGRIDRYTDMVLNPNGWEETGASQRDEYAELAGY